MKKQQQLGINPGTASHRLVKDLLFKFVVDAGHKCFRCDLPLTRGDFSIEHIVPWLDSNDPAGLYFDLANIAFSHRVCNFAVARKPSKAWSTEDERKERDAKTERNRWQRLPAETQRSVRREKYLRYGC